jgi:hypothetical protein
MFVPHILSCINIWYFLDPEYDIIIAPSTEYIHIKPSENIPLKSLKAFTIALWGKRLYGKNMSYVHYYLSAEKTLLSFYIDEDVFNLEIADASKT